MSRVGWLLAVAALVATVGSVAAWQHGPALSMTAGASLDGAQLFQAKGCATCHPGPDTASPFGPGYPSLADAPSWAGDRRPGLSPSEYLSESIRDPGAFISPAFQGGVGPTGGMPTLEVSEAEVAAIVDYLLAR